MRRGAWMSCNEKGVLNKVDTSTFDLLETFGPRSGGTLPCTVRSVARV